MPNTSNDHGGTWSPKSSLLAYPRAMSTSMRHFIASAERILGYTHVILITTGGVASIKAPQIVHELLEVHHLGFFGNRFYLYQYSTKM